MKLRTIQVPNHPRNKIKNEKPKVSTIVGGDGEGIFPCIDKNGCFYGRKVNL